MKKKRVLINVGNFVFSTRRLRAVYKFIYASFGVYKDDPDFDEVLKLHSKEILWFYEGEYIYGRVLRLFSIRPRSRKEISDFILRLCDNTEILDVLLDRLDNFIDDKAFAEYELMRLRSNNPKGDKIIKYDLLTKGISKDIIEEVLSEDVDKFALMKRQYDKKSKILYNNLKRKGSTNLEYEFDIKMKQYLLSKGFELGEIKEFLKNEL